MVFTQFTSTGSIAEQTISRWAAHAPTEIVQAWREHGTGLIGDGYVRMVDPDRAELMLGGVMGLPDGAVPVFTTGLADLVIYKAPFWHILRFRFGVIDLLAFDTTQLMNDLEDADYCDRALVRQPFPAGVQAQGMPGIDQCFGFVPLLALGGPNDPSHLDKCGIWEHFAIICQLAGPPANRPQPAKE